jgi:hypothetical protein
MDTITVIVNGTLFQNDKTVKNAKINLLNLKNAYEASSDNYGRYSYFHIKNGTYCIKPEFVPFKDGMIDSVILKSGNVYDLKINISTSPLKISQ